MEFNTLKTIDLFSGAGGLSSGLKYSGFQICGEIESNKAAAKTHALNFNESDIAVYLLLIHSQESATSKESIKQVIFLTDSEFIFLSENKRETYNLNVSLVELL